MNTHSTALNDVSAEATTTDRILQTVLAARRQGNFVAAANLFNDQFTFTDHALGLEFKDKDRLIEFFQKSRELFPDTVVEVVCIFECGDHAIAEWKLTATQTTPCGSISYRFPILLRGSTILQIENGRVTRWSDYYDENTSRRVGLAAFFTEWIEY